MAAVEMFPDQNLEPAVARPALRLVPTPAHAAPSFRSGPLVAQRRAARARMLQRRRRSLAALVVIAALVGLATPGLAFGGTTATGMAVSSEAATNYPPGTTYIVAPGDTLQSIAAQVNPLDPRRAYNALRAELRSTVVITGEHIPIP